MHNLLETDEIKIQEVQSVSQWIFKTAYTRIILCLVELNILGKISSEPQLNNPITKEKEKFQELLFCLFKPTKSRGLQTVK